MRQGRFLPNKAAETCCRHSSASRRCWDCCRAAGLLVALFSTTVCLLLQASKEQQLFLTTSTIHNKDVLFELLHFNRSSSCGKDPLSLSTLHHHEPNGNGDDVDELLLAAVAKYLPKTEDELSIYTHGFFGLGAVLELEDPMGGRQPWCLLEYYELWRNSSTALSRQHGEPLFEAFFDWLDFQDDEDHKKLPSSQQHCSSLQWNQKRYRKYTSVERSHLEVIFDVGNGRMKNLRHLYNSTPCLEAGIWHLIWGTDEKLYLTRERSTDEAKVGHSSIFCGRPVLFAGELLISPSPRNNYVEWISDMSGHYSPSRRHMRRFVHWLEQQWYVQPDRMQWKAWNVSTENDLMDLPSNWLSENDTSNNDS